MKAKKIILLCSLMTLVLFYSVWIEFTTLLLDKTIGVEKAMTTYPFSKMKYILQWTKSNTTPFIFMGTGQSTFMKRRCPVNNCFITSNRGIFHNLETFDAVLFHGPELNRAFLTLPTKRSLNQKYVFVSIESSAYYPLCHERYDRFFNWTWTYKINSDEYFGYIIIKNKQGDIIGPREVMRWLRVEDMEAINDEFKENLQNKKIAAAWFVSNCKSLSGRDDVAKQLGEELAKYNLTLDIYGNCGTKKCPKDKMAECFRKVEKDYYFYLSFENSFSEDYVTEKLLNALQHYAVPIVYGGANYSRFMPDGSYLNARTQSIEEIVKQIVAAIHNKEMYYNYFRWHNHYSYHSAEETPDTDYYCKFCKSINDADLVKQISVYENFRKWWNSHDSQIEACSSATDLHSKININFVVGFSIILMVYY